ncbi:hypothetical protein [Pseudonocardia phyllosphaerae]|uniref:hypothetical protein n=1 Tax=Pseudonocardia phyllosphaerae TaxID=3390502 RepID=UPI00397C61F3
MSSQNSTSSKARRVDGAERAVGVAEVMTVGVRIAGEIPTRVDLQHAGTEQQMLGLSLGTVLVYLRSHLVARTIALAWGQAAPMARSLSPLLPAARRPVVATGPWSVSTMVRFHGVPTIDSMLMTPRSGTNLPTMLRVQVGAITWELADAASYTALLNAWRQAADLLAIAEPTEY